MADAASITATLDNGEASQQESLEICPIISSARWFAAYTASRREKQIVRELDERRVESFLPLYRPARRPNSHKLVRLPLFPSYVFVHIALHDQLRVLQVPGVVRLVSFNGHPAALEDSEIEAMRNALSAGVQAEPYPYIKIGREVEILSGPLRGLRGKVIRKNNRFRVVLSVDLLQRSIVADLDSVDIVSGSHCIAA